MTKQLRVGLIDYDIQVRQGRRLVVESQKNFTVVYEGQGLPAEIETVGDSLIDLLVIEQRLGSWSGVDFFRALKSENPNLVPAAVLTAPFGSDLLRLEALEAGIYDLASLDAGPEELITTLGAAAKNSPRLSLQDLRELLEMQAPDLQVDLALVSKVDALEPVAQEALERLRHSWLKAEKAKPEVSEGLKHLMQQLEFRSFAELVIRLHRSGILNDQ
jgi:DNA-binding NarL/FixJ family response regulator